MDECLSDEVASGSGDEKKIRAARQRALRKKKNASIAKSGQKLSIFCLFFLFGRFACSLFSLVLCRSNITGTALPAPYYTINVLLFYHACVVCLSAV